MFDVESRGEAVGLNQSRALTLLPIGCGRAFFVPELDVVAGGQLFDRFGEREVIDVLDERDDNAPGLAGDAVVEALRWRHMEGRRALFVERAQSFEASPTRRLEGDMFAHYVVNAGPLTHRHDIVVANTGHPPILSRVPTPHAATTHRGSRGASMRTWGTFTAIEWGG